MFRKHILVFCGALVLAALCLLSPRVARADTVITNCSNDSQLTSALASGGMVTFNCGTATITFSGQKNINVNATIDGGGKITISGGNSTRLFYVNAGKALTLNNLILTNGYSGGDYGGAIYVNGATLTLNRTTIQNSRTLGNFGGGAIVAPSSAVTINNSILKNNSASVGGALSATGTVNISNSQFLDNTARYNSGAVSLVATALIQNSTFTGNRATEFGSTGGAIYVGGNVTIQDSTINENEAGKGGGIFVADNTTLDVTRSTLNGNLASDSGGGIYALDTFTLLNTTVSGNKATNHGGGILLDGTGTGGIYFTLLNVTIAGNSAASYGGLDARTGSFSYSIKNTLVAKGAQGANCNVDLEASKFNLSDDGTCDIGNGRDSVVLHLGPLAYNGSSTKTHLLLAGSAALDNATNSGAPATDQRGSPRPQGTAVDVGAVEICTIKPDKPSLASPLNNAKYKGTQVALDWDDAPCADKYKITLKDAATGTKVQGGNSGTSDFKTKALVKGKTYTWFVQACNTIGCTKSDTWKFTVK